MKNGSNMIAVSECNLCRLDNAWQGPNCSKCPNYRQKHYFHSLFIDSTQPVDFYCISESPTFSGISENVEQHTPWNADIERLIRNLFTKLQKEKKYSKLNSCYTYAIRCAEDKPNIKMVKACADFLHPEIMKTAFPPPRPIMVFAIGPAVLQSLGYKVKGYKKLIGQPIELTLYNRRFVIMPTISKRQLLASPDHYSIMHRHALQFLELVTEAKQGKALQITLPPDVIAKDYRFPKTTKQVKELVEEIIEYKHRDGLNPAKHLIALDTETNTLFPHRSKTKILSLVVSWGPGLAASIPIEHEDSPFELSEIAPYIQQLLTCNKPKTFHNAKYDLRILWSKGWDVRNVVWDTMLGEHLLAEAKKGHYGLKTLVQMFIPKYAGYEEETQTYVTKHKKELLKKLDVKSADLKGTKKKLVTDCGFAMVPLKKLNVYGAIDADATRNLTFIQKKRIITEQEKINKQRSMLGGSAYFKKLARPGNPNSAFPLNDLMKHHVLPVSRTLAQMEAWGMRVDRPYVTSLAQDMDKSLRHHKINLLHMIPKGALSENFNPKSVSQLRRLLFSTGYKHPVTGETVCYKGTIPEEDIPHTPTGFISTNAKFLRTLKNHYECAFANALLEYRALSKARDTFIENILVLSEEDGKMHTTFNIHGTATGRLSSVDENMQNIPMTIGEHNLKRAFIPTNPDTEIIVNADAKAAEVRLYAAYSRDKNLIEALNDGLDPHSYFSANILNPDTLTKHLSSKEEKQALLRTVGIDDQHSWSYEDFQKRSYFTGTDKEPGPDVAYGKRLGKLRSNIKRVVFGILYGASPRKIASIVGIPESQGKLIVDSLFERFPTISKYIDQTKEKVRYLGVVETFFGRRRRLDTGNMTFKMRRKAERQAINMLIQSTSSDIILEVLTAVDEPIRHDFGGHLLITVHDSLVAEIPKKYASQLPDFIYDYGVKQVQERHSWLPVPLLWDVEVGPSYGQLDDVDKYLQGKQQYGIITDEKDDFLNQEIQDELLNSVS